MALQYEESKEIIPGGASHDFRYLNLIRERNRDTSLVFRLFASKTERPALLEVGDIIFYPESFSDARDARRVFYSVTSFNDFIAAVEGKKRESRRILDNKI